MKIGVGTGIPGRKVPAYLKDMSFIMGSWLLLIQAAMERPAVNIIRVATMGWILKYATKVPLKAPKRAVTTMPTRTARNRGIWRVSAVTCPPQTIRRMTLPAMAIVAPTEISCPPEDAVTRVIPIARITSSEALSSTEMMFPLSTGLPRLFSLMVTAKKEGSAIRLKITSRANAAKGMNSCCRTSRLKKLSPGCFTLISGFFTGVIIRHLPQWSP